MRRRMQLLRLSLKIIEQVKMIKREKKAKMKGGEAMEIMMTILATTTIYGIWGWCGWILFGHGFGAGVACFWPGGSGAGVPYFGHMIWGWLLGFKNLVLCS
jgi:hypothetical protein